MTKQTWAATCKRIKQIIRKDASLQYFYEVKGENCVIGGLAKAASIGVPSFEKNGKAIGKLTEFAAQLRRAYPGLTEAKLGSLQTMNDHWGNTRDRREHLLAMIDRWKK